MHDVLLNIILEDLYVSVSYKLNIHFDIMMKNKEHLKDLKKH